MATIGSFSTRHPVLTYFVVTLAISCGGFLFAGGSGLLAGTSWQTDPRFMAAVSAMLAGPPVAGILLTGLVSGAVGLRRLLSRVPDSDGVTREALMLPRKASVEIVEVPEGKTSSRP